jgi:hypothetical protein
VDLWIWIVMAAALIGLVSLIVWLLKWRDPAWTEEDENRSELWSTRSGGGAGG